MTLTRNSADPTASLPPAFLVILSNGPHVPYGRKAEKPIVRCNDMTMASAPLPSLWLS